LEHDIALLADFERTFRAILADYQHRFAAISVSRRPPPPAQPNVTFSFEDAWSVGMFACWASGECDLEIRDGATGEHLLSGRAQVANTADVADEVRGFLAVLLQRQPA
jgi:hypothetical protein